MGCDSISWCECSKVSIGYVKKILKFFWVHPIKHTFLVFKQHYTYFHIFFHPHVFTHMFSNNKIHVFKHMYQTPLKKVRIDNEINLIEAQHFFFFWESRLQLRFSGISRAWRMSSHSHIHDRVHHEWERKEHHFTVLRNY